ncbi:hypothetical protein BS47DRAFT_1391886 [Hydnum rufescens UP504]|uniref:Uncharacterized protein n=1 Tax=Hydnum rufescens UP504 TaxID=1448309 RepID=A0A9P6B004_9AGAM|nr:hypothetical protein BS47DRAFT_1391886 [Hydnum rufescens UP504]
MREMCAPPRGDLHIVDELLPHERMTEKMELENSPRDLRLEQVYTLDLHFILPSVPGTSTATSSSRSPRHGDPRSLATQLKDHLVVLTPECYPHIYDWVSYPVQAMLSMAWRQVIALLERSLAYAYTGSAKVISRSLMEPMFTSRAIIDQGYPMVNQSIATVKMNQETRRPVHSHLCAQLALELRQASPGHMFRLCTEDVLQRGTATMRRPGKTTNTGVQHRCTNALFSRVVPRDDRETTSISAHFPDRLSGTTRENTPQVTPPSPTSLSPLTERLPSSLKIAINALVRDTVTLVREGVREDSASRRALRPLDHDLDTALAHRDDDLIAWANDPRPLDFGNNTHATLLRILNVGTSASVLSLPGPKGKDLTPAEFAASLYHLAGPDSHNRRITDPFLPKGSAHPVFVIAFEHLHALLGSSKNDTRDFAIRIFAKALPRFGIRHVPTAPVPTGSGAPTSRYMGPPSQNTPASFSASQRGQASAQKDSLPIDWSLPPDSADSIAAVYKWVHANFAFANPLHRFALILAIVLAKCAPSHSFPKILHPSLFDPAARAFTPDGKNIRFVTKLNSKGHHNQAILFNMWAVYIIALVDSDSPMGSLSADKKGMGPAWTKKHGSKGISSAMLIFLGIAWGSSITKLVGGYTGIHWGIRSKREIITLFNSFSASLNADPTFGPYDAVASLIGHPNASALATSQGLNIRASPLPSLPSSSSAPPGKRPLPLNLSPSSPPFDNDFLDGPSSHKRIHL